MYHVLIFQQGGQYVLDGTGEVVEEEGGEETPISFNSLDELILFLTGHNLKVGEDDIQLTDTCPCVDDSMKMSSNGTSLWRQQPIQ